MTASLRVFMVCAAIVLVAMLAGAQGNQPHFAKDGLSFDYVSGWNIADESNSDAQQLTLTNSKLDAQVTVFVHRGTVDTPEKFAQAKKAFIDPYVKSVNDRFVGMGARPETRPVTAEVGGAKAEGVRLRASLGGDAAEANIFWVTLGSRVVVLTFFRPDDQVKQSTATYEAVRTSIKVEPPPPKAAPSKKPA